MTQVIHCKAQILAAKQVAVNHVLSNREEQIQKEAWFVCRRLLIRESDYVVEAGTC